MSDNYAATNSAWPAILPPITKEEARRAARKLMRHFGGRRNMNGGTRGLNRGWVRRCWISTRPRPNTSVRGWWRLVHDVSHRVHRLQMPHFKDHGLSHAELELQMVLYVIEHDWLFGKLKTKEREMTETERRDDELEHARRMLATWERRAKLAATKVKLWKRRQARIEKQTYLETFVGVK